MKELTMAGSSNEAHDGESTAMAFTMDKCREISGCPSGVALQDWLRQLAAERIHVRARHLFIRALAVSILEHSGGRHDWRGAMEDASDLVKAVDEVYSQSRLTDRSIAVFKADAIDEAAVELERIDTVASTRAIAFKLREFSKQLREGAENEHHYLPQRGVSSSRLDLHYVKNRRVDRETRAKAMGQTSKAVSSPESRE